VGIALLVAAVVPGPWVCGDPEVTSGGRRDGPTVQDASSAPMTRRAASRTLPLCGDARIRSTSLTVPDCSLGSARSALPLCGDARIRSTSLTGARGRR
jgi:hypothetical protein